MCGGLRVSIITVSLNSVNTIERTICSVIQQSYKNIEYIIIDGASTDGTQEVIKKYKDKIAYYISEPDNGIYDAMNKGIDKATGDIIGIINSDDWYEKDVIEKIVNCFQSTCAELVYGKIWWILKDGDRKLIDVPLNQIWHCMAVPHPSVFVKHDIYIQHGMFNCEYDIAADYDLILRLYVEGVKFVYLDEIIANLSFGGISSTNTTKCAIETGKISLSYIDNCPISERNNILKQIKSKYNPAVFNAEMEKNPQKFKNLIEPYFDNLNSGVIIWGTGVWGKKCCDLLQKCNILIKYYIDNNSDKWGQNLMGIEVKSPQALEDDIDINVIVSVRHFGDVISEQLRGYNNSNLKCVTLDEILENMEV
jgi:glycosyltransferase involved in cell wall biosynthesis